jgi:Tol biopolymer transport system component
VLTTDTNALYAPGGNGKSYLLWLRGGTLFAQEFNAVTLQLRGDANPVADPVARTPVGQMSATVSNSGLLLYSATNTLSQFTWLDRTGKPLGTVGEPGDFTGFRLSPDGRRTAMSEAASGGTHLWLLEMARGVASRLTSDGEPNLYPVWSPDGSALAYRSGYLANLFRRDASGTGGAQRLTQSPNIQDPEDWSRDGSLILYHQNDPQTRRDLWILPVTPDGRLAPNAQPRPYLRTPFSEYAGRFSPEAPPRWVAYQSDESGRYEIYIQAFPEPHGAKRISTGGGQYPQWGAGGRELFYLSPDLKLMAVSLKLGADSIEPSAPRELFPLPADDIAWSPYDAAPDGQRFLVHATPQQAAQPLTVIVKWPALLKNAPSAQ